MQENTFVHEIKKYNAIWKVHTNNSAVFISETS